MKDEDFDSKFEWMKGGYWRRLKVPWGWLVERREDVLHDRSENGQGMIGGWDFRVSICFIFDPFHRWKS